MNAQERIQEAIKALQTRKFYTAYPENPRAYAEDANAKGLEAFQKQLNEPFPGLYDEGCEGRIGEEVSPYMQVGLGVDYPKFSVDNLINNATHSHNSWKNISVAKRAEILLESLDAVKEKFFELAYATMHTTGQSFVMSFQASGPHANDRALESIALGYHELTRYDSNVEWVKNMGKFDLKINKNFKPISKGIGLVIGCSTFPTWNTVPGVFANLIVGNAVIVKPHPKSILPIAIVIAEMQKVFASYGLAQTIVQLAPDVISNPITKDLAENSAVQLIDYTGGSQFGEYIESLPNKTVFTEKAGVNSLILESVNDPKAVFGNIAFSASLYSGQMCTAPQNIFVSKDGIKTADGNLTYDEVVAGIQVSIKGLADNPKMGPYTLGAIQNDLTKKRVETVAKDNSVSTVTVDQVNPEFPEARMVIPMVIGVDASDSQWKEECFGPLLFVVKTDSHEQSLNLAEELGKSKGAITCSCYTTNEDYQSRVEETMNNAFVPVSFNFTGAAFVNQHAAFSDFHVTGGNPSGNATFTDSLFVNRRFVWVGNRFA